MEEAQPPGMYTNLRLCLRYLSSLFQGVEGIPTLGHWMSLRHQVA